MGQPDVVDGLECSDQRLIFRLLLKELKRLRSANFKALAVLAAAKEECRTEAIALLEEPK